MNDSMGLETTASNIKANMVKHKKKITIEDEDTKVKNATKTPIKAKGKKVSGKKAKPQTEQTTETKERRHLEKHKVTVYLLEEEMLALDNIIVEHIKKRDKRDRSSIMAEALTLLYRTKYA